MTQSNPPKPYLDLLKIVQDLPQTSQNPNKAKFYHLLLNSIDQALPQLEDYNLLVEYLKTLDETKSPNFEMVTLLYLKSVTIAIKYKLLKLLEENPQNIQNAEKIAFAGYLPAFLNQEINIDQPEKIESLINNLRNEIKASILYKDLIPPEKVDIQIIYTIINFLSNFSTVSDKDEFSFDVKTNSTEQKKEILNKEEEIDYLELDGGKTFFSPDELFKSEAYQKLLIESGYFNLIKIIDDLNKLVHKFTQLDELKSKEAFAISNLALTENMFHSVQIQNLFQKYKINLKFPKPNETPNIFSFNEKINYFIKGLITVYNYISDQLMILKSAIFSNFIYKTEIETLKAELNALGRFIGRLTIHSTIKINPKTGQIDEHFENLEKMYIHLANQAALDLSKIIKIYIKCVESNEFETAKGSFYENIEAEAKNYLVSPKIYVNPLILTADYLESIMLKLGLKIPQSAYLMNATPKDICITIKEICEILNKKLNIKV